MLDVRRWAEIRRMKEVEGLSIHEIVRRTAMTATRFGVRCGVRAPPRYQRPPRPSKLDPFKAEIHRLQARLDDRYSQARDVSAVLRADTP